jgi:hypothetical protein
MKRVVSRHYSKIINASIILFLSAVLIFIVYYYILKIVAGGNAWLTGDWLINYSAGFVRRGAFGQLAMYVSTLTNIELIWVVGILQIMAMTLCYYLVLVIFFKTKRSNLEMMLLLSPAFLLFPFYGTGGGFRKEILVFIPFLLYLLFLYHKQINLSKTIIILSLYAFAILSHELSVLVLPFFLAVTYLFSHSGAISRKNMQMTSLSFMLLALAGTLIPVFFSGAGRSEAICNQLVISGLNPTICDGAVKWLEYDLLHGFKYVLSQILNNNYISTYIASLTLSLIPFMFIRSAELPVKKFFTFMLVAFVFLAPLYPIAVDWGRWIYIYIFLSSSLVFVLSSIGYLNVNKNIPIILIVVNTLFWSIPHCGGGGLGSGMENYFIGFLGKIYVLLKSFYSVYNL